MGEMLTAARLLAHRLSGGLALSRGEIKALEDLSGAPRTVKRGTVLVEEGARSETVWILAEGWAFREKNFRNGQRQIISIMLPGELTEKGPMLPFGAGHTVAAATAATLVPLDRRRLAEAAEAFPRIGAGLFAEELMRHALSAEWLVSLGRRSAEERLAYLFYETYCRLQAMGMAEHGTFCFPLTQSDVADVLALSSVHVNRTLQVLKGRGLIQWRDHVVTIADTDALRNLAGFSEAIERVSIEFNQRASSLKAVRDDRSETIN